MITNKAKQKVALFLKEFFQLANVGAGGDSTNPNQNVLDVPILAANTATTNAISDDTTIDFTVSYTGTQLEGNTIRELGIFSDTMPADNQFDALRADGSYTVDAGGDVLLDRINFNAVGPFANSDQIDITLTIEVE
jgi:hypothetical protein